MKAYVLHGIGDFRYEDIPFPLCPKGWAIVKVKASGICSSDIARIYTKGTYHFPTIPGHEFSGIVEMVGSVDDACLVGKHVGVFPLIPCKKCKQCIDKHYEMCSNYDYIGSRRDGAFAEYVLVPVWNLIELPSDVPYIYSAMLEPLSVALHAVKIAKIKKDTSVAIVGTGMIGIAAAQWAKILGASKVVLVGRSEAKRSIVEDCNIEYVLGRNIKDIRYSVVIEAVGSPSAIDDAINLVETGGNIVLMGNPSGDINLKQKTYWAILRRQLTVLGTWNSSYDGANISDWTEVVKAIVEKKLILSPLVSHIFTQESLVNGLELMRDHNEPYCKVITLWNE